MVEEPRTGGDRLEGVGDLGGLQGGPGVGGRT